MIRRVRYFLATLCLIGAALLFGFALVLLFALRAQGADVLPPPTGLVTDAAHVLSEPDRAALDARLRAFEQATTVEFAVAIVPSLGGDTIEAYANRLFHAWGIGKKGADNGLLFLWAPSERKLRFEVGYGLEARLPDGRAGQIIREAIAPRFREGQFVAGLNAGVSAVVAQLGQDHVSAPATPSDVHPVALFFFVVLPVGFVLGLIVAVARSKRREKRAALAAVRERQQRIYVTERRTSDTVGGSQGRHADLVRPAPTTARRDPEPSRASSYTPPVVYESPRSYDTPSSSPSIDFSFGGGDSGGGGATGDY